MCPNQFHLLFLEDTEQFGHTNSALSAKKELYAQFKSQLYVEHRQATIQIYVFLSPFFGGWKLWKRFFTARVILDDI